MYLYIICVEISFFLKYRKYRHFSLQNNKNEEVDLIGNYIILEIL